jgi:hypothetical protein
MLGSTGTGTKELAYVPYLCAREGRMTETV